MAAIEILDLEKSYLVGFWRKRPRLALRPFADHRGGEVFGFLAPTARARPQPETSDGLVFQRGTARLLGCAMDDPREIADWIPPEQPYFYDHLSARELLNYYAQLSGVPAKGVGAGGADAGAGGIERFGGDAIAEVFQGHVAAVGLAQAILHDPSWCFWTNRCQAWTNGPSRGSGSDSATAVGR